MTKQELELEVIKLNEEISNLKQEKTFVSQALEERNKEIARLNEALNLQSKEPKDSTNEQQLTKQVEELKKANDMLAYKLHNLFEVHESLLKSFQGNLDNQVKLFDMLHGEAYGRR